MPYARCLLPVACCLSPVGCGQLQGFSGDVPPLTTITVQIDGDLAPVVPPGEPIPKLSIALVWGMQWLPEAFCFAPTGGDAGVALEVQSCRDVFGFVPARVEATAPAKIGEPSSIALYDVPGADVLVGDVTARVAYGTLVAYDDHDGDGTLTILRADKPTMDADRIYAASFLTMTQQDSRLAFREGAFVQTAYYPRNGCDGPPPGFSILAASGFDAQTAKSEAESGQLPMEQKLGDCAEVAPDDVVVHVGVNDPASFSELLCTEPIADSSVKWLEPPTDKPADFDTRKFACVHPMGVDPADPPALFVGQPRGTPCKHIDHYVLTGCREDPDCGSPDWSDAPPSWWPC